MSKLTDYCSSKYAAVGLHDALTAELKQTGKHGVKTTVICPVFINTGMFHGVSASYEREKEKIFDRFQHHFYSFVELQPLKC